MELFSKRQIFVNFAGKKPPFCEELRNFVAESKSSQNLYANCEGSYGRRVMSIGDRNSIENFIYYTMYCDGVHDITSETDVSKRKHVEEITEKLTAESKKFNQDKEIHFTVVWVYFFSYSDRTQKSTPVFKIYKNKSGNEAVFLDVSLILYESWDFYLEFADLPFSFLCVPRNGEYCFIGESGTLDLEFLCSKGSTTDRCVNSSPSKIASFQPFSQVAIRPWLIKMKNTASEEMEQIKEIICKLYLSLSGTGINMFNFATFCTATFFSVIGETNLLKKTPSTTKNFWSVLQKGSTEKTLNFDYWLKEISSFFREFTITEETVETLKELYCEFKKIVNLLKASPKDWAQIFRSFCFFFKKSHRYIIFLMRYFALPPVLEKLYVLLVTFDKLSLGAPDNNKNKNNNGSEKSEDKDLKNFKHDSSLMLGKMLMNSPSSENQIANFQPQKSSVETKKELNIINQMVFEKVFANLPLLETNSVEKIQKQFIEDSKKELFERVQRCSTTEMETFSSVTLAKVDGYAIFLLLKVSVPELSNFIYNHLGKNFVLKPLDSFVYNVIQESGKVVGTVFFPQQFSAIFLFSLDAIREQGEKIEPLELGTASTSRLLDLDSYSSDNL